MAWKMSYFAWISLFGYCYGAFDLFGALEVFRTSYGALGNHANAITPIWTELSS